MLYIGNLNEGAIASFCASVDNEDPVSFPCSVVEFVLQDGKWTTLAAVEAQKTVASFTTTSASRETSMNTPRGVRSQAYLSRLKVPSPNNRYGIQKSRGMRNGMVAHRQGSIPEEGIEMTIRGYDGVGLGAIPPDNSLQGSSSTSGTTVLSRMREDS